MSEKGIGLGTSESGEDVPTLMKKYAESLVSSELKVRSIVVMGSRARGDWKPWSDTDVLIIVEGIPKSGRPPASVVNPMWGWGHRTGTKVFHTRGVS